MYRPKDWKNPFRKDELTGKTCYDIYEAGADAMLEVMIKYIDETFGYDYSGVRTRELLGKEQV